MGKVLQFPVARLRRPPAAHVFTAFGELQQLDRAQARLLTGCAAAATLFVLALQLVAL